MRRVVAAGAGAAVLAAVLLMIGRGAGPGGGGEAGGGASGSGGGARSGAGAHSDEVVVLGEAAAVWPESFSVLSTVRELGDGGVVAADALGQVVVRLDMDAGSADTVGAVGEGPSEYRQPDAVWPLPGGRTLLVDLGNGRLTELGPELEFGPTRPYSMGDPTQGQLVLALPQAVDALGRLYFRGFGLMGMRSDSATILRLDLETEALDSVGSYKLPEVVSEVTGDASNRNERISQVPLSAADAWGAAPDGRLVVARVADYRVEWIAEDGRVTRGPPVPHEPVAIGRAEREEWAHQRLETGGGLGISIAVNNGAVTMQASRGGSNDDDEGLDDMPWPEFKPAFYGGVSPIRVDGAGRGVGAAASRGRRGCPVRCLRRRRRARHDRRAGGGAPGGRLWERRGVRGPHGRVRPADAGAVRAALEWRRLRPARRSEECAPAGDDSASTPAGGLRRPLHQDDALAHRCARPVGLGEAVHARGADGAGGDRVVAQLFGDEQAQHQDRVGPPDHDASRSDVAPKELQHHRAGRAGADGALHDQDAAAKRRAVARVPGVADSSGQGIDAPPEADRLLEDQEPALAAARMDDLACQLHSDSSRATLPRTAERTQSSRLP